MPMPIEVPLRSRRQRRGLVLQKLNHAIPAVGLFFAGAQAIGERHTGFGFYLGVFELVSSAALIVLFIREARSALHPAHPTHPASASAREHRSAGYGETSPMPLRGEGGHHGVDWVDIAAGFVLVAEALEHWHLTHHLPRPTILTAISTFALGLFHGRLASKRARRRVLRITEDGLFVAGRPFKARRLDAAWDELSSIDVGARWAVVTTRAGRTRKLDLDDLEDAARVRGALTEARQRLTWHRSSEAQEDRRPESTPAVSKNLMTS
jgi:hypothetical protein